MSPLAPLRTIPMSMKRPFDEISDSRKKQRKHSTIAHTLETQFKVPALPIRRALTPSTSTVAASSSPPRLSSPARDDMESVEIVPGTSLIFGRHRHRPDPSSSKQPSSSSIHLRSSIPTHLHHLVTDLDSPTSIIYLSRYASHASRTHALVEYDEEKDGLKVLVIGQNGMKIGGKRVLAGQRVEIPRRERVFLDFYGTRVGLIFPEKVQEAVGDLNMLFTPSSPERLSLPPSSPPLEPVDDVEMEEPIRHASPLFSRDSSPLSAPSDDEDEIPDPVSDPASEMSELAEDEAEGESGQLSSVESRELTPPPRSQSREKSVKREMLETVEVSDPVPDGIDLAALLASTVVFSGSSKLSLPDLVKHMLDSQPSLREKGEESRWLNWAGGVLENNPMFGKVQRHGKDSSGHPLLPHFFYIPANDPDTSRAAELGGLVRPLRTVQRAGGKAIDWRPVGSGRRRY